jgi:secondary thiamine-phosphate synthase enzyme
MNPDPPLESFDSRFLNCKSSNSIGGNPYDSIIKGEIMIELNTRNEVEIIDMTSYVEKAVKESSIEQGICLIYTLHTTMGIVVNEAETGLIQDMAKLMVSLVPQGAGYLHDRSDGNAHAHLQAMLLGNSVVIPVECKRPILGTWQKILFVELDGPRRRRVCIKIIKE